MKNSLFTFSIFIFLLLSEGITWTGFNDLKETPREIQIPILLYHRFGPSVTDGMTVTTTHFESQLQYLRDSGYTVIPLRQLVDYYLGKVPAIPSRSVVITIDDGHKSVYSEIYPLLKKYQIPATLFIYPSALSRAAYTLTWDQLREMKKTGLLDFQSHTFWHPNFRKEKNRLTADQYANLVENQLEKSKGKMEKELRVKVEMLAWPFGIYDDELVHKAVQTGYMAAFTIERRSSSILDNIMTLPRYLMVDPTVDRGKGNEHFEMAAEAQLSSILQNKIAGSLGSNK